MQNKVQIVPDELGNVIRMSNNPEFGYVRLSQDSHKVTNGFVKRIPLTTLLHGELESLRSMDIQNKTELSGKIVVKEQLIPFSTDNSDRDYKIAGNTGIICCVHGEPIYRKTFFTEDVTAENILLDHTNGDAIRSANNAPVDAKMLKINKSKPVAVVTPEQAFDIEDKITDESQVDLEDAIEEANDTEVVVNEQEEVEVLEESTFEL
jgi:hypothetical protein|tara:strand:+ start:3416 stop:4036 length:621 start_codon:yes stop_codon:yes gene_type:complete